MSAFELPRSLGQHALQPAHLLNLAPVWGVLLPRSPKAFNKYHLQFRTVVLPCCSLQNPKVDLLLGSFNRPVLTHPALEIQRKPYDMYHECFPISCSSMLGICDTTAVRGTRASILLRPSSPETRTSDRIQK